jgi:hypothetical protein
MVNSGVVEQIAATALVRLQSVPFFPLTEFVSFPVPFDAFLPCPPNQRKRGILDGFGLSGAKPSTPLISFHVCIHS